MVDNIDMFIKSNKKLAKDVAQKTHQRDNVLDLKSFTIAGNPKKTYLPPKRLDEVPAFDFSPLDAAFFRLKASALRYERALSKFEKGSLSAEQKAEINNILKKVDQALIREEGLPRRDWFKNMIYAPGFYTGYGVKTLPGIREGLEERKWDEVDLYILEVSKAIERASNKIKKAALLIG